MSQKDVIKNVLDEFFDVRKEINKSSNDDILISAIDEVDTDILSEAINEALEGSNEDTSQ